MLTNLNPDTILITDEGSGKEDDMVQGCLEAKHCGKGMTLTQSAAERLLAYMHNPKEDPAVKRDIDYVFNGTQKLDEILSAKSQEASNVTDNAPRVTEGKTEEGPPENAYQTKRR